MQEQSYSIADFHLTEGTGEHRIDCPECGGRKALGINTDDGRFGCFKCGLSGRTGGRQWLDRDEWIRRQREMEQARNRAQLAAQLRAQQQWNRAALPAEHGYLERKQVGAYGVRQHNKLLLVPACSFNGTLWTVQFIAEDGGKRFLTDGKKRGMFHQIGRIEDEVVICEGYATAATLYEHIRPGVPVVIAFDAGNLRPVAETIRKAFPRAAITIAADNDCWTAHNTGLTKGREAAAAISAELIYPSFANLDTSSKPTDFNDYNMLKKGLRQ